MTRRTISLISIFVLSALIYVVAQTHSFHDSTSVLEQVNSTKIDNLGDKVVQISQQTTNQDARLRTVEGNVATLQGAIWGFGGLLTALQLIGIIRRPQRAQDDVNREER